MTGMLFTAVYPVQFLNVLASEGQKISENVMHWDYYSWLFFKEKKKKATFYSNSQATRVSTRI